MPNVSVLAGVSNNAVLKATGKSWDEWIAILDKNEGKTKTHTQIAQDLVNDHAVSSWWSQQLTVGYEFAKGRRTLGETKDTGFQVGVSKTLKFASTQVWDLLVSAQGLKLWLGGLDTFKLEPKFQYLTHEKTGGQVRTISMGTMIRLTYQPKGWARHSTLQVRTTQQADKTILGFHQENLKDGTTRTQMKKHWQEVIDRIEKALSLQG